MRCGAEAALPSQRIPLVDIFSLSGHRKNIFIIETPECAIILVEVTMLYRKLGKTGCDVSILGFGCMRLPVVDGNPGAIDEAEATRILHASLDLGVNYIDTAYPYHQGMSEPFVGKALNGSYRERVYLATKLPSWAIESTGDFDNYLNEQLGRLQTDRIDFYLIHALKRSWWQKLQKLGVGEFLERAIKDGRIRFAGFSFHAELDEFKEIVDQLDWSFCQIQYNFMDQDMQAGKAGMEYAASRGLGIIAMEPLRGGKLAAGVPADIMELWNSSPVKRAPAEWALRWIWNHPEISIALSGMNAMEQVEENCRIANEGIASKLSAAELDLINRVRERYLERIKIHCTGCSYCIPCPGGVNIPRIFSIYNDLHLYDEPYWARVMYSLNMEPASQATACNDCGQCEESCPQKISIRELLKKCHDELYAVMALPGTKS
jgi:uncharacterized protein